jgi:hypothetical protein
LEPARVLDLVLVHVAAEAGGVERAWVRGGRLHDEVVDLVGEDGVKHAAERGVRIFLLII